MTGLNVHELKLLKVNNHRNEAIALKKELSFYKEGAKKYEQNMAIQIEGVENLNILLNKERTEKAKLVQNLRIAEGNAHDYRLSYESAMKTLKIYQATFGSLPEKDNLLVSKNVLNIFTTKLKRKF